MDNKLFVLPVVGTMTLVSTYILIILKRSQKQAMLSKDEPVDNGFKIADTSEKVWWPLCLAGVFLMYLGLISLISQFTRLFELKDALFVGILVFLVLLVIGRRF